MPPTSALRPVIPINARTLRITAAAGTELADPYSYRTFNRAARARRYPGTKAVYNPLGRLPARGMAGSVSRPLPNIPYCSRP